MGWLTPGSLILGGLLSVLLLAISTVGYRLLVHPLARFPGPRLWAASRLPWIRSTVRGTIVKDLQELHDRFGPVVRVAPDELSYIDSQAVAPIYQSAPEMPKDPMHLPPFHNGAAPGILAADHEHHRRYRRALAYGFSDQGIKSKQPLIQRHIDQLLHKLDKRCSSSAIDICEWYNWTTFDIIGDLAFGEPFGCLENAKTHDWIASIQGNVKSIPIVNALRRVGIFWILPWILPRTLQEKRKKNAQYSEEKVNKRLAAGGARGDLWDAVIGSDEKKPLMSKPEIISNASAIVVAGSETSATLLSGCTWLLMKHPDVYQRLIEHVRSSFDEEEEITLMSVGKLDYMLAVIDEALRLYPPVPMQANRLVRPAGASIAGEWIPGGTSVALQHYAACRSDLNFRRPSEFLPQRWLGDPAFADDNRTASHPFSVGPRNCIGRQLAYAEMRLILARILWKFDMELDHARMGTGDWILEQPVWVLWYKSPLWVKLKPRADESGQVVT
ncbi:cytochrome P450 [Lecanosticta acicola]|uniref:Cytochrome P450 n=1 Tax=Lecanosticta acicola TaxID=111012 RepID=A0AAI9EFP9_9PEZI|nr:cytochrome P450 [Lecanosticta acicola]